VYEDRVTGASVRQLTNYKGHSHHLYFTNPGWHDQGRRLLIGTDRAGNTRLCSLDLAEGSMRELLNVDELAKGASAPLLFLAVNPVREEAYFWCGQLLLAIDLTSGETRPLYEIDQNYQPNICNVTADGRHVCSCCYEAVGDQGSEGLLKGYLGFREYFQARAHSQVLRVAVDGSGGEVVHEEHNWIGHVNTSPTQPHLLSFCHEGPWADVAQRMWMLDMQSGKVWKLRPQEAGDAIGHEYWLEDGLTIGYHGKVSDQPVFGFVRYDNTERIEQAFPFDSNHYHSNTQSLIVGDGPSHTNHVLLWQFDGKTFTKPRILCEHRGSRHIQQLHIHPRFSPDGKEVLFTSDMSGYGQVYLVDVPKFESLPEA
jgi:oligogalacturonide lyase